MKWRTLSCVITTPLGVPVDPEVKRMCAASPGRFALGSRSLGARATSSHVNDGGTRAGGVPSPSHPTACVAAKAGAANRTSSAGATPPPARIQRSSHAAIIFSSRGAGLAGSSGT